MKKIRIICLLFISLFVTIVTSNNKVEAKSVIKSAQATDINANVIGKITFYDDYTIEYTYVYRVKDIKIWVCTNETCLNGDPLISYGQTYIDGETITYDLKNYFSQAENDITYQLKAEGDFKVSEANPFGSNITLTYELKIRGLPTKEDSDKIVKEAKKIEDIFNTWVIPFIYIAAGIVFIIRLIMLCIDLVKYSDNADVRKEKIRGFLFTFIGIFVVLIVNSSVGFITGLFD